MAADGLCAGRMWLTIEDSVELAVGTATDRQRLKIDLRNMLGPISIA